MSAESGPPFGGTEPCPMCPMEIRGLAATAHNLINRWDSWKRNPTDPNAIAKLNHHMECLRDAKEAVQPLTDAHFADRLHSHGEVDRQDITLADGSPVTEDHRERRPDGQQKGYVVLSAREREKGFVRPFRDAYVHGKCGQVTTMGRSIAETYARDPGFYGGTFCVTCKDHFKVGKDGEFNWYEMDGSIGPKVGV